MADINGDLIAPADYSPFGVSTGLAETPYGYTGKWNEPGTGLLYLRSRWYSPQTGIFTSKDTYQGVYRQPLSLNRWIYVKGNPVRYSDPSGMISVDETKRANEIVSNLKAN